jgi:hypothetical protein
MADTPTKRDVTPTNDGLAGFSHWTRNYVRDRPVVELFNFAKTGISVASFASVGNGAAPYSEVATSDTLSLHMDTGDINAVLWTLPADIDLSKDIDLRAMWSNSAGIAAANTSGLAWKYTKHVPSTTTLAAAATSVDSQAGVQASFGANIPGFTSWSTITGGKINPAIYVPGEGYLTISVTCTLVTLSNIDLYLGQVRYYRLSV